MLHYGWFRLFGPPASWGSGVRTIAPPILPDPPAALIASARAPDDSPVGRFPKTGDAPAGTVGQVIHRDPGGACGRSILKTRTGSYPDFVVHWYTRTSDGWAPFEPPSDFELHRAVVVCPEGRPTLLLERYRPWWPYETRSYGRFLASVLLPELRPEHAVYRVDLDSRPLEESLPGAHLFPGEHLLPAPDRRWVAYLRSHSSGGLLMSGLHNVMLYDGGSGATRYVASLREGDVGSGVSFGYRWTPDSTALVIEGHISGSDRFERRWREVSLAYLVETGELYDLAASGQGSEQRP